MCKFSKIIKYFRKKKYKKISRESTYLRSSVKERSLLIDLSSSSSSSKILLINGVPMNNLDELIYKRDYKNNPLLMHYLSDGELSSVSVESDDSLYLNE